MKNKFIYVDGRIVPCDDKKFIYSSLEYQDNIYDIFLTEDIIEGLENSLKEIEFNKKESESKLSEYTKLKIFSPLFWCSILFLILPTILGIVYGGTETILVNNLNYVELLTIIACPIYTLIGAIFTLDNYLKSNKIKKTLNAINMEEEFLNTSIKKYKEKLNELKKDKTKNNESSFENDDIVKINYKDYLNAIKDALLMCRSLGYKKEYNDDYKKEKLNEVEEFVDNKFKTLKKEYK